MIWSDWHHIERDWRIPAELLPCRMFQLSWLLEWELDPLLAGGYSQHKGKWKWQIAEAGELFLSSVEITGTAIWFPGAGELIAWYIQTNRNNPVISTTVPVRPSLLGTPSDAASWYQRADGSWGNEAETGTITEEGWVPGAGLISFPVYAQYESAVYEIPLSGDLLLKVPFHTAGAFLLPKRAGIMIRTAGSGGGDACWDRPGYVRTALPNGSYLLQQFSGDAGRTWNSRRISPVLSDPRLFKDATNALYCAGWKAKEYLALVSPDDGRTWSRWRDMLIWDGGYSDVDTSLAGGATIVSVARRGGAIWFRSAGDNFSTTTRIGNASKPMMLTVDPRTQALLVTDGQSLTYRSLDGGRSWQAVAGV